MSHMMGDPKMRPTMFSYSKEKPIFGATII